MFMLTTRRRRNKISVVDEKHLTEIQNANIHNYRIEWNRNYDQHSSSLSSIISRCHARYDANHHDDDDELKKSNNSKK